MAFMSPKLWCRTTETLGPEPPTPTPTKLAALLLVVSASSGSGFATARVRRICSFSQSCIGLVHVQSLPVKLALHTLSRVRYICDVDDDGTGELGPYMLP